MTELGKSLMAASPHRPRQAMQRSQWSDPDEIPEEPTDFRDTQRHHHRPRWRLNWLNELVEVVGTGLASLLSRFFTAPPSSDCRWPAPSLPTWFPPGQRPGNRPACPAVQCSASCGARPASAASRLRPGCSSGPRPSRRAGVPWLPLRHSETATLTPGVPWPADPPARAARSPPPTRENTPPTHRLGRGLPALLVAADCCHRPYRPSPRPLAPPHPACATPSVLPTPAWWQTPPLLAPAPLGTALGPESSS